MNPGASPSNATWDAMLPGDMWALEMTVGGAIRWMKSANASFSHFDFIVSRCV
jgi:hypothetical protein